MLRMNLFTGIVLLALFALVMGLVAAWPVMLLWGAIAGTYGWPTMGLGTAFQVSWLTSLLFKSNSVSSN
jgi:hypothetical protein